MTLNRSTCRSERLHGEISGFAVLVKRIWWSCGCYIYLYIKLFCWVGGLEHGLYFSNYGYNHRNWLAYLSWGLEPPTRRKNIYIYTYKYRYIYIYVRDLWPVRCMPEWLGLGKVGLVNQEFDPENDHVLAGEEWAALPGACDVAGGGCGRAWRDAVTLACADRNNIIYGGKNMVLLCFVSISRRGHSGFNLIGKAGI